MSDIRIWRSPCSRFGCLEQGAGDLGDETMTANAAYSDAELAGIAGDGCNAIWGHGILRHLVRQEVFAYMFDQKRMARKIASLERQLRQ